MHGIPQEQPRAYIRAHRIVAILEYVVETFIVILWDYVLWNVNPAARIECRSRQLCRGCDHLRRGRKSSLQLVDDGVARPDAHVS